MSIRFNCPHCQKAFNVKNELAGKKAQCSGCKKVITIPAPQAQPASIEDYAAAALADEPKPEAPPEEPTKVQFTCPHCDAQVEVAVELAGKQSPCPECRRIIKVPLIEKQAAKDWRKVETRIPSGARQNFEPAPEGTWDARAKAVVSRDALIEADALPIIKEPLSWSQLIKRSLLGVAILAIAGFGIWFMLRSGEKKQKELALAYVLGSLEPKDVKDALPPVAAAQLHQVIGEYCFASEQPDSAVNHYRKCRTLLASLDGPLLYERELALGALAAALVDLGGGQDEVTAGRAIKLEEMQKEMRQTWQLLKTPEGRQLAMRALVRKLTARRQGLRATALAMLFQDEAPELLGILAVALHRAGVAQNDVLQVANQALGNLSGVGGATAPDAPKPPPAASLIAAFVALGRRAEVDKFAPLPPQGRPIPMTILAGHVHGLALTGNWDQAQALAHHKDTPAIDRLLAMTTLAEAAHESGNLEFAKAAAREAINLVESELRGLEGNGWALYRLLLISLEVGLAAEAAPLAKSIGDSGLRGRAQLALLHDNLAAMKEPVELSYAQSHVDKTSPSFGLALQAVVRHRVLATKAAAVRSEVDQMETEKLRPFGCLGIVLAMQDKGF